jgi:hypothetical protein
MNLTSPQRTNGSSTPGTDDGNSILRLVLEIMLTKLVHYGRCDRKVGVTGPVDWRAGEDSSVGVSSGLERQANLVAAVPSLSNQRWWGEDGQEVL